VLRSLAFLILAATAPWALAKEAAPAAADPALEQRVMALSAELRCLVCQNQTIADSSAPLAEDLRNQVREKMRQKINENLLVLVCGSLGAPYIQLGHDISVVVNNGDELRVLPVVSDGAFTNVRDVLYLKGVDLGITTVQTLNALKASGEYGPNIDRLLTYVAPLSVDTLHILARPGINTIFDLKGKKVNFNSKGSGTARFTPQAFERAHRLERPRVVDPGHARHAELDRIGEEVPGRSDEAAGEVGGLLHERGVRGALHRVGHVLHRAVQVVPEELEGQGIETHDASRRMRRLPNRSTIATSPAGTSTVVSACSTMAGPTTRSPPPRLARS